MSEKSIFRIKKGLLPIGLFIGLGIILRILPHPPNMAPIAAMALFGGVYLDKKYALLVPLIALFLSDIVLGFHDTMFFVYGSFILTGFIGLWVKNNKRLPTVMGGIVLSSLLFFFITNFGVWLMGSMYPKTISGLLDAYFMGLPFFRNTLLGDFLYVGLLFGAFETIRLIVPNMRVRKT